MTRAMKDSGNDWIGKIPTNYTKYRFKNICILYTGNSIPDDKKEIYTNSEDARPYISSKDIDTRYCTVNYDNGLYIKIKDNKFRVAKKNDTLMCIEGGSAGKKKAFLCQEVSFVNKLCCFSATAKINSKYLFYFLNTPSYEDEFKFNITGMIGGVSTSTLKNLDICLPPLNEQQKIADYLDKKCGEIDAIAAKIQEQITTLEEYKKSVISETVTKGLNPNASMKDSGIEWIGQIPANWEVDKFKYHLQRKEVKNKPELQVLSLYRELGVVPKDSRDDNHNVTSEDTSKYKYVKVGYFVVNKMKAWQGSVAVSDYEGIVSPAYYVYEFNDNKFYKRYFHYLLRGCYKDEFMRVSGGIRVGQWDLPADKLENMLVLIPSPTEQKEIADYLDSKCSQIEETIADKQKQIETLEEYKKTLIYEYVTGKKEVA